MKIRAICLLVFNLYKFKVHVVWLVFWTVWVKYFDLRDFSRSFLYLVETNLCVFNICVNSFIWGSCNIHMMKCNTRRTLSARYEENLREHNRFTLRIAKYYYIFFVYFYQKFIKYFLVRPKMETFKINGLSAETVLSNLKAMLWTPTFWPRFRPDFKNIL